MYIDLSRLALCSAKRHFQYFAIVALMYKHSQELQVAPCDATWLFTYSTVHVSWCMVQHGHWGYWVRAWSCILVKYVIDCVAMQAILTMLYTSSTKATHSKPCLGLNGTRWLPQCISTHLSYDSNILLRARLQHTIHHSFQARVTDIDITRRTFRVKYNVWCFRHHVSLFDA